MTDYYEAWKKIGDRMDDLEALTKDEITKDQLWELLGCYAFEVGAAEGVLFTKNKLVVQAVDEIAEKFGLE